MADEKSKIEGIDFSDRSYENCRAEDGRHAKLQPKTAEFSQQKYEFFRKKVRDELKYISLDIESSKGSLNLIKDDEVSIEMQQSTRDRIKKLQDQYNLILKEEKKYVKKIYKIDLDSYRPLKTGEIWLTKIRGLVRKILWCISGYERSQDSLDIKSFTNQETQNWMKERFETYQSANDDSVKAIVDYPQTGKALEEDRKLVQQSTNGIDSSLVEKPQKETVVSMPQLEDLSSSQDSIGDFQQGSIVLPVATDDFSDRMDPIQKVGVSVEGSRVNSKNQNSKQEDSRTSVTTDTKEKSLADLVKELIGSHKEAMNRQADLVERLKSQDTKIGSIRSEGEKTEQKIQGVLGSISASVEKLNRKNDDLAAQLRRGEDQIREEEEEERDRQGVLEMLRQFSDQISKNGTFEKTSREESLDVMLEDHNRRVGSSAVGSVVNGKGK